MVIRVISQPGFEVKHIVDLLSVSRSRLGGGLCELAGCWLLTQIKSNTCKDQEKTRNSLTVQTCFLLRGTAQLIEELMTLQGFNESSESTIPLDPALPSARSTKPCKVTCASFDCAVSLASCDSRQLAAPDMQLCFVHCSLIIIIIIPARGHETQGNGWWGQPGFLRISFD